VGSSTFTNNTGDTGSVNDRGNDIYNDGGKVVFDACGLPVAMADCCTLPPPTCYSCDTSTGNCAPNRAGSQARTDCIKMCQCTTPHNCGQLNGTVACNKDITGCNVCDACCKPWITVQASCDGCFAAPTGPYGCGNQTSAG